MRQEVLANITSSLVGGLVLWSFLFMGYVMEMSRESHDAPIRTSAMACFSSGHCPLTLSLHPE